MPSDLRAWGDVLAGLDAALRRDVTPETRRHLIRMRERVVTAVARRPQYAADPAAEPVPDNVIPIDGGAA
jgi:hypothetical protein